MKRTIIGLALTTGVALITAVPAQAAAPKADPVKALKSQYVAGKGVKTSSTIRMSISGDPIITTRESGVSEFGTSGVAASDKTMKFSISPIVASALDDEEEGQALKDLVRTPTRQIDIKRWSYLSGGLVAGSLPEGKTWVRGPRVNASPLGPEVDLFTPGTLKALLASASSVKNGVAKGTIKVGHLPSRPAGFKASQKLTWALWFDGKGLVSRFTTKISLPAGRGEKLDFTADSRFSGWGSKVKVTEPAAETWVDAKDLDKGIPTVPGMPEALTEVGK
ncbi:hypothetical protein AB0B45_28345 [Nonomuraea sp. NPDC049152]|uniref:hypothetical protein n=1 Tax=Nonomuraea sp. NPDC049152 TaxID=3154350 RepID=UPI0033D880DF